MQNNIPLQKIGCAIFDDPDAPLSGWACLFDEEDPAGKAIALRFKNPQDLSSDSVYWTNLEYAQFSNAGFSNNIRFRQADYLRPGMIRVVSELGLDQASAPEKAKALARVFGFVIDYVRKVFAIYEVPMYNLSSGIREYVTPPDVYGTKIISDIVKDMNQAFTRCATPIVDSNTGVESLKTSVMLPRHSLAKEIFDVVIPITTQHEVINDLSMIDGRNPQSVIEWVIAQKGPMMIQASFSAKRNENIMPTVINYGTTKNFKDKRNSNGQSQMRTPTKQWVTGHEILLLCRHYDCEINTAVIFEKCLPIKEHLPMIKRLVEYMDGKDDIALSYAFGLLLENTWTSLLKARSRMDGQGRKEPLNMYEPFVRAVDRVNCAIMAGLLYQEGIDVLSYALGRLNVRITDNTAEWMNLCNLCSKFGAIPPKSADYQHAGFDSEDMIGVLQQIYNSGDQELIMFFDTERYMAEREQVVLD